MIMSEVSTPTVYATVTGCGFGFGVWWFVWGKVGFWWGALYGLFWPIWLGYRIAAILLP